MTNSFALKCENLPKKVLMANEVIKVSFLRENVEIQDPKLSWGMAAPLTHLLFWVLDIIVFLFTLLRVLIALHDLLITNLLSPLFFMDAMYPKALMVEAHGILTCLP